jgi:uncharacterized membrane protein
VDNYIAIFFDNDAKAIEGLHALWKLDNDEKIAMHGAVVVRRNKNGEIQVATDKTDEGVRTAIGLGLGALLGALAGPIGAAAGITGASTVGIETAAGVGAATGSVVGLASDTMKAAENAQAEYETQFVLKPGQSAVVTEVSEDQPTAIDSAMKNLGGRIYRRSTKDVRRDALLRDEGYDNYLYTHDYEPYF